MSERNRDKVKRLEHELGRYQKKVGELMKANAKLREVEDAKGVKTKDYLLKKKLMQDKYGITIREV